MFGHVWTCLDNFGHILTFRTIFDMFGQFWICMDNYGHFYLKCDYIIYGWYLSEANFRFFAEFEICKRCLGTGGFCMLFALSAYLKVFIVSDRSASVGLTQAIMQV